MTTRDETEALAAELADDLLLDALREAASACDPVPNGLADRSLQHLAGEAGRQ